MTANDLNVNAILDGAKGDCLYAGKPTYTTDQQGGNSAGRFLPDSRDPRTVEAASCAVGVRSDEMFHLMNCES